MQQQVELAGGQRASIPLLPVQHQVAPVAALLLHELRGVDEHAAGAGRRVADSHALAGLQQLNDQPHHRARRVELPTLLAGVVGELINQVFVGVAQDIVGSAVLIPQVAVAQVQVAEVVEQLADDALAVGRAAQPGFVVPVDAGQHAVQPLHVLNFDVVPGHVEGLAQVHGRPHQGGPASGFRHEELVLVVVRQCRLARHARGHGGLDLFVEPVRQPLQEQHRKDVVLVIRRVDLPAQDVRGLPELGLQFLLTERHRFSLWRCGGVGTDGADKRVSQMLTARPRGVNGCRGRDSNPHSPEATSPSS